MAITAKDGYDQQIDWILANPAETHKMWANAVGLFRRIGELANDCGCLTQVHSTDWKTPVPEMTDAIRRELLFEVPRFMSDLAWGPLIGRDRPKMERFAVFQRAADACLGREPYIFSEGQFYDTIEYLDLQLIDGTQARPWAECLAEAEKAYNIRCTEEWDEGNRQLDAALEKIAKEDANAGT